MHTSEKQSLPWWQKYTLTLEEASEYFGISYKKASSFLQGACRRRFPYLEWESCFD